jgi:hypothetical protein
MEGRPSFCSKACLPENIAPRAVSLTESNKTFSQVMTVPRTLSWKLSGIYSTIKSEKCNFIN